MNTRLADLCDEIALILESNGYSPQAVWIRERTVLLRDEEMLDDARASVLSELHRVTLGMGGLYDLEMHPQSGDDEARKRARARLDDLTHELSLATRSGNCGA